MFVEPIKTFVDQKHGTLERGVSYDLAEADAQRFLRLKLVRHALADGTVVGADKRPMPAAGAEQPSSASPVAPASPQTTAKSSGSGGKRRRKARAAPSS